MSESNTNPPPVMMLRARLDNGWLEEHSQESFGEPKPFFKYLSMEEMAFRLANRDREKYDLHFHMESFNDCSTYIKARLWDEGVYFRPHLFKDGFLRLIPHFSTIIPRSAWHAQAKTPTVTNISSTAGPMTVATVPVTQTATVPATQAATQAATIPVTQDATMSVTQAATVSVTPAPVAPVLTLSKDTNEQFLYIDEDEESDSELFVSRNEFERRYRAAFFNPELFRPVAKSSLPKELTQKSWKAELEKWQERLVAEYKPADERSRIQLFRRKAAEFHVGLIRGKYGMRAVPPCDSCAEAEAPCLVYHADCYSWADGGQVGRDFNLSDLGWRCERCRRLPHLSEYCDAQFDPKVYLGIKTEKAERKQAQGDPPDEESDA